MTLSVQKRREKQKAELRSELVDAAHKLVQEEGYEGLTIRKLAKRVGYAPMSVYSYFADKQDILFALAEDAFETLARRIEEHPADGPSGNRLLGFCGCHGVLPYVRCRER